jgi:iron complex outermembrane receptor protein
MKQILKVEIIIITPVLRYYKQIDLGIPEDGIAEQTSSKKTQHFQGKFNHLLSLNSVI